MTPLSAGGTMERCSIMPLSLVRANTCPPFTSSPFLTSIFTGHFLFSSRAPILMPLAIKSPAMASIWASGRPMPSKIPPTRPGPRRMLIGSIVG